MSRRILVSGATGKQGGALISALLSHPPTTSTASPPFEIYALTRNTKSSSATRLASLSPRITLVQGDFKDPASIFQQVQNPWGFFSVTNPMNAAREEAQGKAMTEAAVKAGVRHIVFTATDRGYADGEKEDDGPSVVPHFASKYRIERDIAERAQRSGGDLTWTFLRPVAFYENLTDDFLGKGFVSMFELNGGSSKLKFVSTKDIGKVAAEAFLEAESPAYKNRAIALAGDEISLVEMRKIFREETGKDLPQTFGVVARGLKWGLREQLGIMFDWFATDGFAVDVAGVRKRYPFMKDFREWLRTESAWKK